MSCTGYLNGTRKRTSSSSSSNSVPLEKSELFFYFLFITPIFFFLLFIDFSELKENNHAVENSTFQNLKKAEEMAEELFYASIAKQVLCLSPRRRLNLQLSVLKLVVEEINRSKD